jgi:predicted O-linked N-acetylglucosamine transferase (SPINDLY family)
LKEALQHAESLRQHQKLVVAQDLCRQIVKVVPGNFDAIHLLGLVLLQAKNNVEGLAVLRSAIAINPSSAEALTNLGVALRNLNRHQEALTSYERALAVDPNRAQALFGRAYSFGHLNRYEEALASHERGLQIEPNNALEHKQFGNLLQGLGRLDDALRHYEQSLILRPDYLEAKLALCMAQLPILYMDETEIKSRRTAYQRELNKLREDLQRQANSRELADTVGSSQPFYLAYQGLNDRDLQASYGSFVCRAVKNRYPLATLPPPPSTGEPIRVGIVSGFFYLHSNWKIPIRGWLSQLDSRRFHKVGYYTGTTADDQTKAATTLCDRFVQGPLSIERWRETILADAPHILIYPEIGMDPICAQLAAQRLAPVQCTSWGHPETSGFSTLDYFLSSDLMEPSNAQTHYTERLVRLPNLGIYYEPTKVQNGPDITRSSLGLRSSAVTFWCGQSLFKYLPQYDHVFPRIARETRDSQFVFIKYPRGDHVNHLFQKRLEKRFAELGLAAADHCVFLPPLSGPKFIGVMAQCDVFLDSIGWSGCNSTLESLACDLPIVTMPGSLMRSRHTFAILKMMGVTETTAKTLDDYVSIAAGLARDPQRRTEIKDNISKRKHLVYRDHTCISGLEEFLNAAAHGVWERERPLYTERAPSSGAVGIL